MSLLEILRPAAKGADSQERPGEPDYARIWQINFAVAVAVTLAPLLAVLVYLLRRGLLWDPALLWLLALIVPASLAAVFLGTLHQVGRLREMDLNRAELLKEIVYTHKMAAVGRLAAGVAHEINNPMAVIREKAGLAEDLLAMGPEKIDLARLEAINRDIQENCRRASGVTHRLLGFARHLSFEALEFSPVQVVREVMRLFRQKAHYRDIAVEMHAPPDLPAMKSDPGALEQVIFNLLDNAFHAVKDGGNIGISLAAGNGRDLLITVYDDGHGMEREEMRHIFEPFHSGWGITRAGMGLSITYGIVHKLGGDIHAESDPGEGATFIVRLPLELQLTGDEASEADITHWALHAKGSGD